MTGPVWPGYFADPFVLRLPDGGYAAYGTLGAADGDRVVEALYSEDLVDWQSRGPVLERLGEEFGDEYWAPEVAYADGRYWMYFSVGRGIDGHHIRVAGAEHPFGPFRDLGVVVTPDETFAIDAHPFRAHDGRWYLFYARDVIDHERPGTHLAVAELEGMTRIGPAVQVIPPSADWQIYERGRAMYGGVYDWYTMEGPAVVERDGRFWLTYSGGAWTGPGYAVSWAVADSPLGPWSPAPAEAAPLLSTSGELIGPGHNSLVVAPSGDDAIVFHAWDEERTMRRMHVRLVSFEQDGPRVDGPLRGPFLTAG